MSEPYPSRVAEKIVVRCPDGLRDRLAERAKVNGRSANAEAVLALETWLSETPPFSLSGQSFTEDVQQFATVLQHLMAKHPGLKVTLEATDREGDKVDA